MNLPALTTPALLIDQTRLERNIARMAAQLGRLGVPLRPHLKTVKNVDPARPDDGGASGRKPGKPGHPPYKNPPKARRGSLRIGGRLARRQNRDMTYPRSQLVSDEEPGFFHA